MEKTSNVFPLIQQLSSKPNSPGISELCRIAGVSRSGYYAWLKAAPTRAQKEEADRRDFDLILEAYRKRGYAKGARGIQMTLLHRDEPVLMNIKKIRRLMKKYRLVCPIRKANPYRRLAQALRTNKTADNLLQREFESYGPRAVLLTDITYLPYDRTFAYLSTIIDAYTKEILAYVVSDSLKVDFVLETVDQLMEKHGVSVYDETIIHSDQGCHYTSRSFMQILRFKGLRQSMSRKGNCWDNAPQESFFGHMKDSIRERLSACGTFPEVKAIVDDYIDYYNNDRPQWELAKLSPSEFYRFCVTGKYPLDISDVPARPIPERKISELGASGTDT